MGPAWGEAPGDGASGESCLGRLDKPPPVDSEGDGERTPMPSLWDAYFDDLFIF